MRIYYILLLLLTTQWVNAEGFNLYLRGGKLYGPGNLGQHTLQDGRLQSFIVTGELSGHVIMANNGAAEPNISAEKLHDTPVDGMLSDGTKINENVDVGFVLEINEPETGELVKLFVCSISNETVTVDDQGNLHFNLTAGFDPGLPEFVVKMPVEFVTGLATVPLSQKTLRGESGGTDAADSFKSGYMRVGRLGDFDNDGMLDGEFILGGHAPYELIIAEGDPILIIRPFTSDIPLAPKEAAIYALRGIQQNYSQVFAKLDAEAKQKYLKFYLTDIQERLAVIEKNISRIRTANRSLSGSATAAGVAKNSQTAALQEVQATAELVTAAAKKAPEYNQVTIDTLLKNVNNILNTIL